jgi:hypothetical protein
VAYGVFSDLLADLTGAEGSAAGNYLASQAGLGAVIRYGNEAGLSGRAILDAFRSAGGTVANSTYWQLRSQVLSYGEQVTDAAGLLRGDDSLITEIPGGRAGLYQIDFRVYVQRSTGGPLPERSTTTFSMVQRDLDVDAALEAMDQISADISNPETESGKWLSYEILSIGRYTG